MVEISQNVINIIWAAAIVLFGIFEAVTAQLVSIWFVIGSVAALVSALLGASLTVQIIIFFAVSILALVITRPLVKKFIVPKKQRTNADRVLGQTGIVVEEVNNLKATGQVKVDGKIWSAKAADNSLIACDNKVLIEQIQGVKLIVKSIE